jgi:hypothetical protein
VGNPVPTGTNLTTPYISGSDISGVVYGDYVEVYELVYSDSTVVAFSQIQMTAAGINSPFSDLTSAGNTDTAASLRFPTPTGAISVVLEQSTDSGTTWDGATTGILSDASASATATGLTANTTYEFKLAVTGGSYAGDSNPVDVTTATTMDATLSDLRVDGTTVAGFDPATSTYNVVLPAGTTTVPTVTATVYDTGQATDVVTQAPGLPGPATAVVIAQDGTTTKTYTINFSFTVTPILVTGITVTGAGGAISVVNGETLQMSATVPPANAATQAVTWSVTAGTGNATIDATTGLLTGTTAGTVIVTATATDTSGIIGTETITVKPILVTSITI